LASGVQQVFPLRHTWPGLQSAVTLHWTQAPLLQWVRVWPVQPASVAQAPQVPLLQAGELSGQSALVEQATQTPSFRHLPAEDPLRAPHSALLLQPRQANAVGSQMGAMVDPHWLLAVQATHGPPPGLQRGVAGRLAHSGSWAQPVQVSAAVQTGVLPPQSELARHCTHLPALAPATAHTGTP
jgi:hypothetical protein